jgi:hypothetical protein
MRPIEEMLEEAEMANAESRQRWEAGQSGQHDFLVGEEFKQLREQFHLGNFARLYNETADIKLRFAEHLTEGQRPQPDFAVYYDSGALHCHIEVTEWLEPSRKRDEEYSGTFTEGARLVGGTPGVTSPSPVERLKNQLQKKLREKAPFYPSNTWLLVDDNVGLGPYAWADRPLGDVEVARGVVEDLKNELTNISQIWLLREVTFPITVHRLFP